MVPSVEFPPTTPPTSQVTVASCSPVTVAWNTWVSPSATVATVGEIETPTMETIFTETDAVFEGSATAAAVICTVPGEGGSAGAV